MAKKREEGEERKMEKDGIQNLRWRQWERRRKEVIREGEETELYFGVI